MVLLFFFSVLTGVLQAQEQKEDEPSYGRAFGVFTGPLLPSSIKDVTEVQSTAGFRFVFPDSKFTAKELSFTASNANKVNLYRLSLSARGDFPVDDMYGIFFLGADVASYRYDRGDYRTFGGGHLGFGMLVPMMGENYFRMDIRFAMRPGSALILGFGFELRSPVGKKEEATP